MKQKKAKTKLVNSKCFKFFMLIKKFAKKGVGNK